MIIKQNKQSKLLNSVYKQIARVGNVSSKFETINNNNIDYLLKFISLETQTMSHISTHLTQNFFFG